MHAVLYTPGEDPQMLEGAVTVETGDGGETTGGGQLTLSDQVYLTHFNGPPQNALSLRRMYVEGMYVCMPAAQVCSRLHAPSAHPSKRAACGARHRYVTPVSCAAGTHAYLGCAEGP